MTPEPTKQPRVEFRGRTVAYDYPARHAEAQSITAYDDFDDNVERERIPYGAPRDRWPGGITYATAAERVAYRTAERERLLADPKVVERYGREWIERVHHGGLEEGEVIRTDHRCSDCDVDVGDYHLPGCHGEICPKCAGQSISCGCDERNC